jgi:hypothetical protein
MTPESTPDVPQPVAERFAHAFAAFVDAVWVAVNTSIPNPAIANTPAFLAWQTQALPLLEQQSASIQKGMTLFLIGESRTIVQLALERRGLAKQLDGFSLDFAGPDRAKTLDALETAVVRSAYQLCAAAGIP